MNNTLSFLGFCLRSKLSFRFFANISSKMKVPKLEELFKSYETFMFDADGVLWLKGKVIPGSPDFVNHLLKNNKKIPCNGSTTLKEYIEKAQKMGYDINEENVILTSMVTASYLKNNVDKNSTIYVCGSENLQEVLQKEGFQCFGAGPEKLVDQKKLTEEDLRNLCSIPISAVVSSDDRDFHYYKLMRAANYLKNPSVKFIHTNEDLFDPGPIPDFIYPSAGWIMHSIAKLTNRTPKIMGKPHKPMFDYLMEKCGIDPKRTLMIGDRCDTDIAFGNRFGMDTMLILTGVCSVEDVNIFEKAGKKELMPKYAIECLAKLLDRECKNPE